MASLPNILSLLRAPLGLLFFVDRAELRTLAIFLAMLTDSIDGYLARRYGYTSKFGAVLDPLMDKFFVYTALLVLLQENHLSSSQALMMLSRDFFILLFFIYIGTTGLWKNFPFKSIRWGKVSTAAQFCFLIALVNSLNFPSYLYYSFILFGFLAFFELFWFSRKLAAKQKS